MNFRSPSRERRGNVLSIRPFRRLWIATSLSSLGDWLSLVALASLASALAGSGAAAQYSAVGGVWLSSLLPALILGPLAGAVADRLDRRVNMIVGDVLRAALYLTIPLDLSIHFVNPLTWIYVVQFVASCVSLFWTPAKDASVPNLVPAGPAGSRPTSTACSPRSAPPRSPGSCSACCPWSAGRSRACRITSAPTR